MAGKLPGSAIQSNTISITQIQTTAITSIVEQAGPRVTSLIYPGNDTAGNTVGGQTVYINGSGFEPNNAIYINGNSVPSKSFISASNLSFTTPALSAGIYPVYVINTDNGATAIFVPGYISSGEPTWITSSSLSDIGSTDPWSISLSATGDAPITYTLADGSSLPSGISLAANGLISGTMSSPPESQTQYTFTVVASDAQNQDASRQFTVTVTTGEGVLFANNVLLIHADGANNQNNHAFLDSSNNNFTITRYGNASQGSYSPFSQTGWSGYFDGANDSIQITSSSSLDFPNDFTIECWVYLNVLEDNMRIFNRQVFNSSPNIDLITKADGSLSLRFNATADPLPANTSSATGVIQANKWHHIAVVRNGSAANNVSLYVDGNSAITFTNTANHNPSANFYIGNYPGLDRTPNGYISNFRIVKGTALYTAGFTPPSEPLAPIANTSLLALQSNRLIDDGPNNFTLTRNGDVNVQAFSPFAPGLLSSNSHSVYFDGSGDWLLTSSSPATLSGDFTVEGWVYITSLSSSRSLVCIGDDFAATGVIFAITDAGKLRLFGSNSIIVTGTSQTVTVNSWNHIAFVRSSGTIKLYLNGVADSTTVSNSTAFTGINRIGGELYNDNSGGTVMLGYISNYRLVNGTAVYTTNFTPPTTPLTAITNTVLLTCQSPTFVDNSINGFTITPAGNAVPRKFNPFGQTYTSTAYSTANVGGSVYLDGSGDYLSAPDNAIYDFGTGDFTLESWLYPTSAGSVRILIGQYSGSDGFSLELTTGNALTLWLEGATKVTSSGSVTANAWNHVAACRSGSTLRLFINGAIDGSVTDTTNVSGATSAVYISSSASSPGAGVFTGYMSGTRIVKGTAVYTGAFTPPTTPPTNIANTALLLNYTNAGIFDQTAKNVLETVGDAKVSTAQYKYGTGSIAFDGTGDWLLLPANRLLDLSGDFTIETWLYPTATFSTYRMIIANKNASPDGYICIRDGNRLEIVLAGGLFSQTTVTVPQNSWTHLAVTRSGSSVKAFIDGTAVLTSTSSATWNFSNNNGTYIGRWGSGGYEWYGYMDDFRITNGYARYTSNFTPPTSALKDR